MQNTLFSSEITILSQKIIKEESKITLYKVSSPIQPTDFCLHLGVDPGTSNLGIAVVDATLGTPEVKLWQVEMKRLDNPVDRIQQVQSILSLCITKSYYSNMVAVIEGASYADRYRQVELAEQRASITLWCLKQGYKVQIIPPNTIRKNVFGNGRTKAQDVWTNIPADVANALACCYYSN